MLAMVTGFCTPFVTGIWTYVIIRLDFIKLAFASCDRKDNNTRKIIRPFDFKMSIICYFLERNFLLNLDTILLYF